MKRTLVLSLLIAAVAAPVAFAAEAGSSDGMFTVRGEVVKPGDYPISGSIRLTEALETAGGLTEQADRHRIQRVRVIPPERKEKEFDLFDIRSGRRSDPEVVAGDVITVPVDHWRKKVNVEFKGTPLPEVLDILFKDTGINYTVHPALQQAKVIAKFSNVPLEMAVRQIVASAGATYRVDGAQQGESLTGPQTAMVVLEADRISIGSTPPVIGSTLPVVVPGPDPTDPNMTTDTSKPQNDSIITKVVHLEYVESVEVLSLLPRRSDLKTVYATGPSTIRLEGTASEVAEALAAIRSLDRPESLPRSVKIQVNVEVTVDQSVTKAALEIAKKKRDIHQRELDSAQVQHKEGIVSEKAVCDAELALLTAESEYETLKQQLAHPGARMTTLTTGLEGTSIPVEMSVTGDAKYGSIQLSLTLVPVISGGEAGRDGSETLISLTGDGIISGRAPVEFTKEFDVAVSAKPGEEKTIAAGSAQIGGQGISFDVKASATIEGDRVAVPPGTSRSPRRLLRP